MDIHEPKFISFQGVAQGYVLLSEVTASGEAQIDVELVDGYWSYLIRLYDFGTSSDADNPRMQISRDGGVSYDAGASDYCWVLVSADATSARGADLADTEIEMIQVNDKVGNLVGEGLSGHIDIMDAGGSNRCFSGTFKSFHRDEGAEPAGALPFAVNGFFQRRLAGKATHVRLKYATGNVARGIIRLYGLK